MLNFISVNFQDNWILVCAVRCFDAEIFDILDETDCKTSSRAVAELEGSEWQADKLYIILGKICYGTNHRGEQELSIISICKGLE